jgi:phosphomannomutase/phosphoglucomutase
MMVGTRTLSGSAIQELRQLVTEDTASSSDGEKSPGTLSYFDARSAYVSELIHRSQSYVNRARRLKVVVDGGNGVGGLVGPEVLRQLGCEVIELYTEPDGSFPNHHPDPTVVENLADLRATVLKTRADLGIAWDGDADRIGVVDENGEPLFGDMLLIIFGRQLLKEVDNPIIIADVKCSDSLFSTLSSEGAQTVMAKTGHSLIKGKMKEMGAHLAGEMSGHMFFAHRYFGFDDAIHASARLIEILSNTDQSLSSFLDGVPKLCSTPEIRFDCPDELKFQIVDLATKAFSNYPLVTIDGIRVRFEKGWGLVRASNTQAALVLRFEANDKNALQQYQSQIEGKLSNIIDSLEHTR